MAKKSEQPPLSDILVNDPGPSVPPVVPDTSSPMRVTWPWTIGWGIAAILGILFSWNLYSQKKTTLRYDTEIEFGRLLLSEKEEALKQRETEVQSLRLSLAEKEEAIRLIEARQTLSVALTGSSSYSHAIGKLFWNPTANVGFFIAFDLPQPPEGKVYQLWAIQGGTPVDVGSFSFSQETGSFKMKPIPNPTDTVSLFTITLEPSGGSVQPTGEILLKGVVPSQS